MTTTITPWYNRLTRDWQVSMNGQLGVDTAEWLLDDDGTTAHFLTYDIALDVAEARRHD